MNFTIVVSLVSFFEKMINDIKFINPHNEFGDASSSTLGPDADDDDYDFDSYDSDLAAPSARSWTLTEQILLLSILAFFGVLTVGGNVLVVLCVSLEKSLRTVSNYFLASLSLADLIVGVFMMPLAAYLEIFDSRWPFGPKLCNLWLAADVTASTASILGLIAIAYNRYIAIVKPFTYGAIQKNPYLSFWMPMVAIWLVSAGIASPIVFGVNSNQSEVVEVCTLANLNYLLYSSIFSFFIPSAVMVVLYVAIFRALAKRAQRTFARRNRSSGYFRHLTRTHHPNHPGPRGRSQSTPFPPTKMRGRAQSTCTSPRSSNATGHEGRQKAALCTQKSARHCVYDEHSGVYLGEVSSMPTLLSPQNNNSNGSNNNNNSLAKLDSPLKSSQESQLDSHSSSESSPSQRNSAPTSGHVERRKSGLINPCKLFSVISGSNNNVNSTTPPSLGNGSNGKAPPTPDEEALAMRLTKQNSKRAADGKRFAERLSKSSITKERKSTIMLVIVLVLFFVCWCPFFTSNVINALCVIFNRENRRQCTVPDSLIKVFVWFGYCNSTMNPVVYAVFNLEFRRTLRRLIFGKDT